MKRLNYAKQNNEKSEAFWKKRELFCQVECPWVNNLKARIERLLAGHRQHLEAVIEWVNNLKARIERLLAGHSSI